MANSELDIPKERSEDREYRMTIHAISAIRSIAEAAIAAVDNHAKSPAIAAMLQEQADKK